MFYKTKQKKVIVLLYKNSKKLKKKFKKTELKMKRY